MIDTDWRVFLEQRGFTTDTQGTLGKANGSTLSGPLLMDLSHLGVVEVSGKDAFAFLQGQFSNDLQAVSGARSQLSAYCSPKGRVLALFRVLQTEGGYRLIAPREILESVVRRLRMFVLRAKVSLDISSDLIAIGIAGDGAETLLCEKFAAAPRPGEVLTNENTGVIGVGACRWLLTDSVQGVRDLWEEFAAGASSADGRTWRRMDILDGLPQVFASTVETFIPQMINLDLVDGVSFTKGCYPGQEIVARLRYLGKLKQRMLCVRSEEEKEILPGDGIFTAARGEQRVGTVVDAQPAADGGRVLLATAPVTHLETGPLLLSSQGGTPLEKTPLPYEIPATA